MSVHFWGIHKHVCGLIKRLFWVKITQLTHDLIDLSAHELILFTVSPVLLCMLASLSKIGCNLNGMFQNLPLPWKTLSIVASYRELCQRFSTIVLRNICVSTIPWCYAEVLISSIPSIARKKPLGWYLWPQAIPDLYSNLLVKCDLFFFFFLAIMWKNSRSIEL